MSVELPEAYILATQMSKELIGKTVSGCNLQNCANYQHLGFINTYLSDFDQLTAHKVESVVSRGNTIRVQLDGGINLLLAPEYGGVILYHPNGSTIPKKYHLKLSFTDESALSVTLTGMGIIHALTDEELKGSYVYRRDFSTTASPVQEDFRFEHFSSDLSGRGVNLKTVLVGKDAVVVGLGNAAFQDILYRAGIHPKRKAIELSEAEKKALFDAVQFVVQERIRLGGKNQFTGLYGKRGGYVAAMGPNMKGRICSVCGSDVVKLSLGGGQVFLCPVCQK